MDTRDYDKTFDEWVELKHEPECATRPEVYGEGIFLEAWQRLMAKHPDHGDGELNEMFCHVFSDIGGPANQRQATVASSFIAWLGTNCGRDYLRQARVVMEYMLKASHPSVKRCGRWSYLAAWSNYDCRQAGINGGNRTLEAILQNVDIHDAEIVDHLVLWLGSPEGQELIEEAEAEIVETQNALRDKNSMKARATLRAAALLKSGSAAF